MTTTTTTTATPTPKLGEHLRGFLRYPTPKVLAAYLAVALVARALAGPVGWVDLAVAAGIIAFEPFSEWLIHVFVLHAKPRQVFGRTWEPSPAKGHRLHHEDPSNLAQVGMPVWATAGAIPVGSLLVWLLVPAPYSATAIVTSLTMLIAYEWTHHLIHTTYRPKSRYYRSIWRTHRLHHYRNEHHWFGVTVTLGDRVLGTYPKNKTDVPISPTARTLA
jgi:sterol desaturase/sphingolipid hydroxylase (fatty acid hydroxylase superfamily)